jgi:hypothetical protein
MGNDSLKKLHSWCLQENNGTCNMGSNAKCLDRLYWLDGIQVFRYSVTNSDVPSKNHFGFEGEVVKVRRV